MDKTSRRKGRAVRRGDPPVRNVDYQRLRHPFTAQKVLSEDAVAAIHDMALRLLEDLGLRVLLPEARAIYASGGAIVDEGTEMVRIGRDMVAASLATAPKSIRMRAPNPERELVYEEGALIFSPAGGCPNATDRIRGRRPGNLATFEETLKLHQSFDVIHKLGPSAEPQDVPAHLRHYAMMRGQLTLSDKPLFVYARGRGQIEDSFEMIRLAMGLSEDDFTDGAWATTVINTNSPRQLDKPMAEGIIDFARAGQLSIITPFCLAGAMAPVTVEGALVLQHAECLAGITLAQLVKSGAPVSYGGFSSNVDMKSGAPAFGTPTHIRLAIGTGQLARHVGMPWRSAAGSASNVADMQAAGENHMGLWANLAANATLTVHSAGWLEGGLTFGYEKFINDIEALQIIAELCTPLASAPDDLGWQALADVQPGGHFFATSHTMDRFSTAFYAPLVADLSNHGSWAAAGERTSTERATAIWQNVLAEFEPPDGAIGRGHRIARFIADRSATGGAPPPD
ncbi:trimethylamine methyltransferase family protein [Defluviimonas aestuarii]|uniref:trimethylamine methyltransferase family protein n=1 Tax=Albidovulum aestuarii TaxID=1130726 RepID=UPI00249BB782|nr:trimethylamine methyltransferase family protein [Defluviimonas aestuarii]MDI3335788.1 trimethylamine methyltransferase family protein [Defluviimonas aestuarii]